MALENRVLFLDRDGTLIYDRNYLKDSDQVMLFQGVTNFLQEMQNLGVNLHVVSNQSGVGRNIISNKEFEQVDSKFKYLFESEGVNFKTVKYCIHAPSDNCICRKPRVKLFREVLSEISSESKIAFLGNSEVDEKAAKELSIHYWNVPSLNTEEEYAVFFHKLGDEAKRFFNG